MLTSPDFPRPSTLERTLDACARVQVAPEWGNITETYTRAGAYSNRTDGQYLAKGEWQDITRPTGSRPGSVVTISPVWCSHGYARTVLGAVGRRGVEAGIAFFALLGFFYVPLGRHTAFEHARAVFSTPAAYRAGRELEEAAVRVKDLLLDLLPKPSRRN